MKASDLNLLAHFDALLTCKSVSIAGRQLGISQPAMSSALSRLRYLFNDALLVRQGNKWIPTDRALQLHRSFQPMLQQWQQATSRQQEFDPLLTTRSFSLYATDYVQFAVLPRVLPLLKQQAPLLQLRVLPPKLSGSLEMLSENHVELYIGHYPTPAESLRTRLLFEETSCCLLRDGHPALGHPWSLDAFLSHEHLNASGYAGFFNAQLEATLKSMDRHRAVGATMSSYLALPFILAGTNMIATLPQSVAHALADISGTVIRPTPLHLPTLSISMYWHERYQNDQAHTWLRQSIARVFDTPAISLQPAP